MRSLLAAAGMLFLAACATTPSSEQAGPGEPESPPRILELKGYDVAIVGVDDPDISDKLSAASQLIALQDRPPATLAGLRRRVESDLERLDDVLHSEAYFDAALSYEVVEAGSRPSIEIGVDPGRRYTIERFSIIYRKSEGDDTPLESDPQQFGIEKGMPARGPDIFAAERGALGYLRNNGYPNAKRSDRTLIADTDVGTLDVTLTIDTGPRVFYGEFEVTGLEDVEEDYARGFVPWSEGDVYNAQEVRNTEGAMVASGLFSSAVITPADGDPEASTWPMHVEVQEAPARSLGGGLRYSTDDGFGARLFWEHRNFLGRGEKLRLSADAAQLVQTLSALFRKPRFLEPSQTFIGSLTLQSENSDAFDEESISVGAALERNLGGGLTGSLGAELDVARIEEDGESSDSYLVGVPAVLRWNRSNDALDPTDGYKASISVTPYVGASDGPLGFVSSEATLAAYLPIDEERRFVGAARFRLGSIIGAETDEIPANKRFYAGGGGSVRGFEFRKVGPLDADGDPLGGRSVAELSLELRARVTEAIGVVPFVTGGYVSDEPAPISGDSPRWAAGIGGRYHTAVGPIRFDIAFPLNPRDGIDDAYQFYISLGQAF